MYWIGPVPAIFSVDLELIKEVLTDRTGLFAKDFMLPILKVLLGNGLILANGDDWKRHRNPGFQPREDQGHRQIYYNALNYLYIYIYMNRFSS